LVAQRFDLSRGRVHAKVDVDGHLVVAERRDLQGPLLPLGQGIGLGEHPLALEETMQAFADVVRQGKALYIGVSEWTAQQLRAGHALASELGIHLISNQPQYSMLWRVIESEVIPACEDLDISQIVWSPVSQCVLTGKYQPGRAPPKGTRARDTKGGPT